MNDPMPPLVIVLLLLQTTLGVVFFYYFFRLLFGRGRPATNIKQPHTGRGSQVSVEQPAALVTFRDLATQPQYRFERWRLIVLLVLLFGVMAIAKSAMDDWKANTRADPAPAATAPPPPAVAP